MNRHAIQTRAHRFGQSKPTRIMRSVAYPQPVIDTNHNRLAGTNQDNPARTQSIDDVRHRLDITVAQRNPHGGSYIGIETGEA